MTRQRAIWKGISVVVTVVFLWTNCVWAGLLPADKLAVNSQLADVLAKARVVYTGTALHSTLITEGIKELGMLYGNQDKMREMLRQKIGDEADKLKTLIFKDDKGGIAYYTFSPEGYFYRFTTAKVVDDPFNRLIDRFSTNRSQSVEVPINGDTYYQEIIQVSPQIVPFVNGCLKLYSSDMAQVKQLDYMYGLKEEGIINNDEIEEIIEKLAGGEIKLYGEDVDILDEETGKPNGRVDRNIAHALGLWHRCVHVLVISRDGMVLIQERGKGVKSEGRLDISVGGHVKSGLTPEKAAIEEIRQELGLEVQPGNLIEVGQSFKKEGSPESKPEGYEGDIYKYISSQINREFSSLYILVTDETAKEINRKIEKKRGTAASEEEEVNEVWFVSVADIIKEVEKDIKVPDKEKRHASSIKQYFVSGEICKRVVENMMQVTAFPCGVGYLAKEAEEAFQESVGISADIIDLSYEIALPEKVKVVNGELPYIAYKSPAKFIVSIRRDGYVYITSGLLKLLWDKDRELLRGILSYTENSLADKISEAHGKYLAEEVYLLYGEGGDSLKTRVIKFIEDVSEKMYGATAGTVKYDVLGRIVGEINGKTGDEDSKRLSNLLEKDKESNEESISGVELLQGKTTIAEVEDGRYGDVVILPEDADLFVVGDTHGDSESPRKIIKEFEENLEKNPETYIVFLGDYVNNGLDSIGNLILVLELKQKYPKKVVLLNGNHEFRETYMTVLIEFFKTHWDNASRNTFPGKVPENLTHYSHIRLELIMRHGVEEGERVYRLFEEWGRSLPYICFSKKGIMMSHSLGLLKGAEPTLEYLARGKDGDKENIKELGYEAWKRAQRTSHSAMVNNRNIDRELLGKFEKLGVNVFVAGHTHYRSGDTEHEGRLITICSSDMQSLKAGHYMFQEMYIERMAQDGSGKKEGRKGEAYPLYLFFGKEKRCNEVPLPHVENVEYQIHKVITENTFKRINEPSKSEIVDLGKYRRIDQDVDRWVPDMINEFIREITTYLKLEEPEERKLVDILTPLKDLVVNNKKFSKWISDEDIYAIFYEILFMIFPDKQNELKESMKKLNEHVLNELKNIEQGQDLRKLLQISMSSDSVAGEKDGITEYPIIIDDSPILIERIESLIQKGGNILFIGGTNGAIVLDLLLLQRILELGKGNVSITLAVKGKRVGRDVTVEDVNSLLKKPEFEILKTFKDNELFRVIETGSETEGTNIMDASRKFTKAIKGVDLIIAKGHINMLTMRLLGKGYFIIGLLGVKDKELLRTRHFTGLPNKKDPQGIVAFMPASMETAPKLDRSSVMNQQLVHFVEAMHILRGKGGDINAEIDKIRKSMERQNAPFAMFVSPDLLGTCKKSKEALGEIGHKLLNNPSLTLEDAIRDYVVKNNIQGLSAYTISELNQVLNLSELEDIPGALGASGRKVYSIGKAANEKVPEEGFGSTRVIVSGVVLEPKKFSMDVVLGKEFDEEVISPVDMAEMAEYRDEHGVFFNFLYYITKNLIDAFNRRSQQLEIDYSFAGEYIDCLVKGKYVYPPLYNKGAIGAKEDGGLVFGRIKNGGGNVRIGGVDINFLSFEDIPKEGRAALNRAIVYTPMYEGEFIKWLESTNPKSVELEPSGKKGYYHPRRVRIPASEVSGRYQIVFINNRVIQIRQGETEIPPFGWVLSITGEQFKKIKEYMEEGIPKKDDTAQVVWSLKKETNLFITLNLPQEFQGCRVIMGGGTLLIDNKNRNLFYGAVKDGDLTRIAGILDIVMGKEEGWTHVSSRQTQETDVPPTDNRQPRQIIGVTKDGEFFIFSFAGRFRISSGATYPEALYIIAKELEKNGKEIKYAFLLDDGGSVSTGAAKNGQFYCLMPVASGPSNYPGEVRKVNSVGVMLSKLESKIQENKIFKLGYQPVVDVPDNIAVKTSSLTAAILTKVNLRGKALGLDKKKDKVQILQIKHEADGLAKKIYERIIKAARVILKIRVSEGFGRDEVAESFKANEVVAPDNITGGEQYENAIIDVIEGSNAFVYDVGGKKLEELADWESGATSIIVTGDGVESLGNCPDIYTDTIFTIVPKDKRQDFINNPLDPEVTACDPNRIEEVLQRIANANGIKINDLEVVLMDRTREAERLMVIEALKVKYPGLEVVTIKDGTVAHSLLATFGKREGKHKVVMTVSGAPEGFLNLTVASIFREEGAVGSIRVYSNNVNKTEEGTDAYDLTGRYNFSSKEKDEIRNLRPEDCEDIVNGKKLFIQEDVKGDVEGSFSFITNNGVFRIEDSKELEDGSYKVTILRVGRVDGKPCAWFEDKIFRPEEVIFSRISEGQKHLFPRYIREAIRQKITGLGQIGYYDEIEDKPVVNRHLLLLVAGELSSVLMRDISTSDVERVILYHEQLEQQVAKLGGDEFIRPIAERLKEYYREQNKEPDAEINNILCGFARNYPGYLPEVDFPEIKDTNYNLTENRQLHLLRELLVHTIVEQSIFNQSVRILPAGYKDSKMDRQDINEDIVSLLYELSVISPLAGMGVAYDYVDEEFAGEDGMLERLIREDKVAKVTSNPAILGRSFEKGIYEEEIKRLAQEGKIAEEIYDIISQRIVRKAAERFNGVYEESNHRDGYVSIETNPLNAGSVEKTIREARRLQAIGKNVDIKIAANSQGLEVIRMALAERINVNVTLIFSGARYTGAEFTAPQMESVLTSVLDGYKEYKKNNNGSLAGAPQVVLSLFLSRMDTASGAVDDKLKGLYEAGKIDETTYKRLKGRAAVAATKVIYRIIKEKFIPKFKEMGLGDNQVPRLLLASTGAKGEYEVTEPLRYVELLVGREVINTIPPETYAELKKKGRIRPDSIEEGVGEAEDVIKELEGLGIGLVQVADKLLEDGLKSFEISYRKSIGIINSIVERYNLTLDTRNLSGDTLPPEDRFTEEDFSKVGARIEEIRKGLAEDIEKAKTEEGRARLRKSWREWLVPWLAGVKGEVENIMDYEYWMENNPVIKKIVETARRVRKDKVEAFVHVGIGGSIIPTKAIVNPVVPSNINQISIARRGGSPQVYYTGDSFSPELITELLDGLEEQGILFKTKFNIISKSGTTAETIGTYLVIRARLQMRLEELKERYEKKEITDVELNKLGLVKDDVTPIYIYDKPYYRTGRFFIATTGFDKGSVLYSQFHHRGRIDSELDSLKGEARYQGTKIDPFYAILPVPEGMGGRFSGFSSVGLLLLAVTANNQLGETPKSRIKETFRGVRQAIDRVMNVPLGSQDNVAFMTAVISHIAEHVKKKVIEVLYFFDPKLADAAKLLDELYSESLQEFGRGIDVRPLIGTVDNHMAWNGIIAGPRNKLIRFVMTAGYQRESNPFIPVGSGITGDVQAIEGLRLGEVQRQATLGTAEDARWPRRFDKAGNVIEEKPGVLNYTQILGSKTVINISDLVFTMMLETAILGKLNGLEREVKEDGTVVDLTYLQHWVEGYKKAMRERCKVLKIKRAINLDNLRSHPFLNNLYLNMKAGRVYTVRKAAEEFSITEEDAEILLNWLCSIDRELEPEGQFKGIEMVTKDAKVIYQFLNPESIGKDIFRDYDYRSKTQGSLEFAPKRLFFITLTWASMAMEKAQKLGIENNKVVIARDCRMTPSDAIEAMIKAIEYSGLQAIYVSESPSCAASYAWAVRKHQPLMGIFLTASHLTGYNVRGVKVSIRGESGELESLTTEEVKNVSFYKLKYIIQDPNHLGLIKKEPALRIIDNDVETTYDKMADVVGLVSTGSFRSGVEVMPTLYDLAVDLERADSVLEVIDRYYEIVDLGAKPLTGLRVVVDGANTPSGRLAYNVYRTLGAEVTLINGDVKELFGEHKADPSDKANLDELKKAMRDRGAHMGLAFDLDGDRGALIIPAQEDFLELPPDNLTEALLVFFSKRGYSKKDLDKVGVVRDVLSTRGVDEMAHRVGYESYAADTGYVNLKAMVRALKQKGYAVPIYAERSGHAWTHVTGAFEDPIVVSILFAVMSVEYMKENPQSMNPMLDAFNMNTISYKQSSRFQPIFADNILRELSGDTLNDTGWEFGTKDIPQKIIAIGRHRVIERMKEDFKPGSSFKTPCGELVVGEETEFYEKEGLYRYAVIRFLLNGKDAGSFIFRASANDPSYVCTFETPLWEGESFDSHSAKVRYDSVGGVALDYLENKGFARVAGEGFDYQNKKDAEGTLKRYRNGLYEILGSHIVRKVRDIAGLRDIPEDQLRDKTVFVRVDFNVPLNEKGDVKDNFRIVSALPAIEYLIKNGAKVVLMSHLGRPDGKVEPKMSLRPAAEELKKLLGREIIMAEDCVGDEVDTIIGEMKSGDIVLLENLRFHREEELDGRKKEGIEKETALALRDRFAHRLFKYADVYVNDAFGTMHRAHASMVGAPDNIPGVIGFLVEKELGYLDGARDALYGLIVGGGPKLEEKAAVVANLVNNIRDNGFIMVGGGALPVFLKSEYGIELAQKVTDKQLAGVQKIKGLTDGRVRLLLPDDFVLCDKDLFAPAIGEQENEGITDPKKMKTWFDLKKLPKDARVFSNVTLDEIKSGYAQGVSVRDLYIYDIGERSAERFRAAILSVERGNSIFWNGTMGVNEIKGDYFAKGSRVVGEALALVTQDNGVITVIGGGDTASAAKQFKIQDKVSFVSTAGGASAEFLQGEPLPGLEVLKKKVKERLMYSAHLNENGVLIGGSIPSGMRREVAEYMDRLRRELDSLGRIYGLGIYTMVDEIQIVENLGGEGLYPEGRAPLANYRDGVLKVDRLLFRYGSLFIFEELEHEFLESIAGVIPGSNHAISDVVSTVRNVRRFLGLTPDEQEVFLDVLRGENPIDPDGKYLALLERLRGVREDEIIAGVIRYVMRTKLYEHVRDQLGLPEDIAQKIMALEPKLDDALAVFNEIAKAKQGAELVQQVRETEELTIKVVKTFTGLRVSGLDRIGKGLARMIGAATKQVSSVDRLAGRLVKAEGKKYILVDEERIRELKEAMGEADYKKVEEGLEKNNYFITTELPESKDIIRLVDPVDLKDMPQEQGILYLPMPYTRSSLYMSALVLQAGGDVKSVDVLVKGFISDLYKEILNRDVTEDDLVRLFTRPWEFLPQIRSAIADLNNLRKAIVLIEKAA